MFLLVGVAAGAHMPVIPSVTPSLCMSTTSIHHLSSLTWSPNHSPLAVPLMHSFITRCILVTPNENINIFSSASCFCVSNTVHHSRCHYHLLNLLSFCPAFSPLLCGLPQLFKPIYLHYIWALHVHLSSCLALTDFDSFSLQCILPPLQTFPPSQSTETPARSPL